MYDSWSRCVPKPLEKNYFALKKVSLILMLPFSGFCFVLRFGIVAELLEVHRLLRFAPRAKFPRLSQFCVTEFLIYFENVLFYRRRVSVFLPSHSLLLGCQKLLIIFQLLYFASRKILSRYGFNVSNSLYSSLLRYRFSQFADTLLGRSDGPVARARNRLAH